MAAQGGGGKKRVVMVGITGAGKSALGNLLVGKDVFKTSAFAQSQTKDSQSAEADLFEVVDTIGLCDTEDDQVVVRSKILEALKTMVRGADIFLLVFKQDRFTEAAYVGYEYLFRGILGVAAYNNAVLVVTHCSPDLQFNQAKQQEYLANSTLNAHFKQVLDAVGGRVLFVCNPPHADDPDQEALNVKYRMRSRTSLVEFASTFHAKPYVFEQAKEAVEAFDEAERIIRQKEEEARLAHEANLLQMGSDAATATLNEQLASLQLQLAEQQRVYNDAVNRIQCHREEEVRQGPDAEHLEYILGFLSGLAHSL